MITKIRQFLTGVQFEMKKVSWPTWNELRGSTMVVIGLSMLISFFLFIVDFILSKMLRVIL